MTGPWNDDNCCPHGIPWQFVKDTGCDECLNEASEKRAEEHKRPEWSTWDDEPYYLTRIHEANKGKDAYGVNEEDDDPDEDRFYTTKVQRAFRDGGGDD